MVKPKIMPPKLGSGEWADLRVFPTATNDRPGNQPSTRIGQCNMEIPVCYCNKRSSWRPVELYCVTLTNRKIAEQ